MTSRSITSDDQCAEGPAQHALVPRRGVSAGIRRRWMAFVIIACGYGCYVAIALVYRAAFAFDPQSPPALTLTRTAWDLGQLSPGKTLRVAFPVHNSGGQRLLISPSGESCECVSSIGKRMVIPPGGSHEIMVALDTTKISGPVKLELHFETNDPQHRHFTLVLMADRHST